MWQRSLQIPNQTIFNSWSLLVSSPFEKPFQNFTLHLPFWTNGWINNFCFWSSPSNWNAMVQKSMKSRVECFRTTSLLRRNHFPWAETKEKLPNNGIVFSFGLDVFCWRKFLAPCYLFALLSSKEYILCDENYWIMGVQTRGFRRSCPLECHKELSSIFQHFQGPLMRLIGSICIKKSDSFQLAKNSGVTL